jgi:hypothetical protein
MTWKTGGKRREERQMGDGDVEPARTEDDEGGGLPDDLGGIGEQSGWMYPGEDGIGSIPHMPIEDDEHAKDR